MALVFPNVPFAPGVPPLLRNPNALLDGAISLLTSDGLGVGSGFPGPQWGVFTTDGIPVAIPDNVAVVEFRREGRISDYPVEEGGFASYDKVQLPYDARVRFTIGSSAAARTEFLANIDAAQQSLNLYTIITPDAWYYNANIIHYSYRREHRYGGAGLGAYSGTNLLLVEVWLEEVRVTASAQFTNTKSPSSQDQTNSGPVSATTPTSGQDAVLETTAFT